MSTFIDCTVSTALAAEIEVLRTWHHGLDRSPRVALIYGGVSAEDRLYIAESPAEQRSATALTETLTALGMPFEVLDPCQESFIASLLGFDVVLSNLHGPYGEDGRLQGLLDWLRKPLCGSGVGAAAVAADKILCKRFMVGLGVATPAWQVWHPDVSAHWQGHPVMIKPAMGGSSVGMSLVRSAPDLMPALERAWTVDPSPVLIEDHVPGVPVTVGLLELPSGVLVFPPLATIARDAEFYDAATKLDADACGTVSIERAELPGAVLDALSAHARALWDGLGCHGAVRVDFMVTDTGVPYALEVNTTPGMSRDSNFVFGARCCGLELVDIVRTVLHEALTRPAYDVPLPVPVLHTAPAASTPAA